MVYIVIVNWNGWRHTIECLESILRLRGNEFAVIICDNGSTDGSIDQILAWGRDELTVDRTTPSWGGLPEARRLPPTVTVKKRGAPLCPGEALITIVDIGENLGFAGANNVGMALALADPAMDYVWLLNNDTIVDPGGLEALRHRCQDDPGIGLCGATLIYADAAKVIQSVGVHYNWITGRGVHMGFGRMRDDLPAQAEVERDISYVVGASMFARRTFLETVGLMSEAYFLYFEEIDWSCRNAGRFRLAWAPDAIVFHKEGASIGTNMRERSSNLSVYYASVNLFRFVKTYRPWLLPLAFARMFFLACRHVIRGNASAVRYIAIAALDFIVGRKRRGANLGF
jgi:GT2 family glycosyltransferase